MFLEQIEKNKLDAFQHLVKNKKQNTETITVDGDAFSFATKRGVRKKYICFSSFGAYQKSPLYPAYAERVNGFYFVLID